MEVWEGVKDYGNDLELVNAILSGERRAFEELVRRNERLVHHVLLPFLVGQVDRKDVCQDVFVKVFEKLHTFQFRSKLSTWIGNIAYNTAVNFKARQRNRGHSNDGIPGTQHRETGEGSNDRTGLIRDESLLPDELLVRCEENELLARAIEQLPEIQRSVLILFHKEEISLEEIGLMLELPVNTVKSHLYRSRRRLKELLATKKG